MLKWSTAVAITLALIVGPAEAGQTPAKGLLSVRTTYAPMQPGEGIPTEGFRTFVRIRDGAGRIVYQRASGRLLKRFPPGRYSIGSYLRFCVGNCAVLDPPSDRCSRRLRLRAGQTLRVRIRRAFSGRCRSIVLSSDRR